MKKFSGKNLSDLINKYREEFKNDEESKFNSGSGIIKGKLREETVDMLKHSLSQTSSKVQSLGRVKKSSNGKEYISFF